MPLLRKTTLFACLGALSVLSLGVSARAESADHVLEVKAIPAKDGRPGSLTVVIAPSGPWHWNKDYPAKLSLRVPEGIALKKATLSQPEGDFQVTDKVASAATPFEGQTQGARTVNIVGKFGLCDDKVCVIKKVDLSAAVTFEP